MSLLWVLALQCDCLINEKVSSWRWKHHHSFQHSVHPKELRYKCTLRKLGQTSAGCGDLDWPSVVGNDHAGQSGGDVIGAHPPIGCIGRRSPQADWCSSPTHPRTPSRPEPVTFRDTVKQGRSNQSNLKVHYKSCASQALVRGTSIMNHRFQAAIFTE